MSEWQPIETAPLDKTVLLYWTPVKPNQYAEACVIGQVSSYEPGTWWNGQRMTYEDLDRITHWMPLPPGPREGGRDG